MRKGMREKGRKESEGGRERVRRGLEEWENGERKKGGGRDGRGRWETSKNDPGVHRTFIQLTDSSRVTEGQEIVLIPIHTPTHTRPSAFLRVRTDTRESSITYIYLMPNVDLLCLITGADIDGSVCASKRRNAAPRRAGGGGGEGGIGSGCLFAKSPLSPCGSGRRRSDGGARALSNEMASNIVVVVRGICVGRIGRGWQGPPEWHGKLIIRFWKSWPPIEHPKQTAPFAIPRVSFRRIAPRRDVLLFSDDENRLRFFSRERSDAPVASICRRRPLRCLPLFETICLEIKRLMRFNFALNSDDEELRER